MMGPFVIGDPRLAASYARVEKRMKALGDQEVRTSGAEHARRLSPRREVATPGRARPHAASTVRSGRPSGPGGEQTAMPATPATWAGTTAITALDG